MKAGYRVGFFISPHLSDYNERIQVSGVPIPHLDLVELVNANKRQIESVPELSTFEIGAGLAFLYFAQQGVDAAVIEVGLGGRLDATNIVTPVVSVITMLTYEHTALLGDTLAKIATEKAGIIKPGAPVVLAPQEQEAEVTIRSIAAERGSALYQVGKDYLFEPLSKSLDGQSMKVWRELPGENGLTPTRTTPVHLTIPLLGYYQLENAATAYAALCTANEQGLKVETSAIEAGFAAVSWPGRFEVLRREPPVVVDSAHTRESASRLRAALEEYFPGKRVVLIFGASEDKDVRGMLAELAPQVRLVVATQADHPRAIEAPQLKEMAEDLGIPASSAPNTAGALQQALNAGGSDDLVLAAGSIFLAAETREAWFSLPVETRDNPYSPH
jgi:dihydrofolate synthase/folylpolyglutamate synthase